MSTQRRYKPFQGRFGVFGPPHPKDGGDYAPLAVYADELEARLSAAAPELLEALRACLHFCNPMQDRVIEQARAAIAKAEGQS